MTADPPAKTLEAMSRRTATVAVIDDQVRLATAVVALLVQGGQYACHGIYPDIASALRELRQKPPDILLLDVHLPGMSGLKGLGKLRQLLPTTRILFLTCDDSDRLLSEVIEAEADGLILKGVPSPRLSELLDQAMRGEPALCGAATRMLVERHRRRDRHPPLMGCP